MKNLLTLLLLLPFLLLTSCTQQRMRAQVRESKIVVLDIGHFYHPERGGQGARTPDARYGMIEECEYWYRYAGYTARVIRDAGYECRICCRGSMPTDKKLAEIARRNKVHHVNTPVPTGIYRSSHHPHRMAVGMLSTNYALNQNPAAVVYLHHNSMTARWMVYNKGAIYCNEEGTGLGLAVADVITNTIYDKGGMPNHGVHCGVIIRNDGRKGGGDWLNACNESYVPAIITEATFLSNPEHARFLGKEKNAIRYAEAIGHGVVNFLKVR
ncbi:MAG: N-acetylmuramoyl-L-alanine amidase [Akkermansia sp.]|nr:N-acetylmuramoyl-L-alanine amidase [Akkermansia sp.]